MLGSRNFIEWSTRPSFEDIAVVETNPSYGDSNAHTEDNFITRILHLIDSDQKHIPACREHKYIQFIMVDGEVIETIHNINNEINGEINEIKNDQPSDALQGNSTKHIEKTDAKVLNDENNSSYDELLKSNNTADGGTTKEEVIDSITTKKEANDDITTKELGNDGITTKEEVNDDIATNEEVNNGITTKEEVNNGITTEEEVNNDITTKELGNDGITTKEEVNNGITTKEEVNNGITTKEEVNNDITTKEEVNNGITTKEEVNDGITTQEEVDNDIATKELVNDGITTKEEINDGITTKEEVNGSITSKQNETKISSDSSLTVENESNLKKSHNDIIINDDNHNTSLFVQDDGRKDNSISVESNTDHKEDKDSDNYASQSPKIVDKNTSDISQEKSREKLLTNDFKNDVRNDKDNESNDLTNNDRNTHIEDKDITERTSKFHSENEVNGDERSDVSSLTSKSVEIESNSKKDAIEFSMETKINQSEIKTDTKDIDENLDIDEKNVKYDESLRENLQTRDENNTNSINNSSINKTDKTPDVDNDKDLPKSFQENKIDIGEVVSNGKDEENRSADNELKNSQVKTENLNPQTEEESFIDKNDDLGNEIISQFQNEEVKIETREVNSNHANRKTEMNETEAEKEEKEEKDINESKKESIMNIIEAKDCVNPITDCVNPITEMEENNRNDSFDEISFSTSNNNNTIVENDIKDITNVEKIQVPQNSQPITTQNNLNETSEMNNKIEKLSSMTFSKYKRSENSLGDNDLEPLIPNERSKSLITVMKKPIHVKRLLTHPVLKKHSKEIKVSFDSKEIFKDEENVDSDSQNDKNESVAHDNNCNKSSAHDSTGKEFLAQDNSFNKASTHDIKNNDDKNESENIIDVEACELILPEEISKPTINDKNADLPPLEEDKISTLIQPSRKNIPTEEILSKIKSERKRLKKFNRSLMEKSYEWEKNEEKAADYGRYKLIHADKPIGALGRPSRDDVINSLLEINKQPKRRTFFPKVNKETTKKPRDNQVKPSFSKLPKIDMNKNLTLKKNNGKITSVNERSSIEATKSNASTNGRKGRQIPFRNRNGNYGSENNKYGNNNQSNKKSNESKWVRIEDFPSVEKFTMENNWIGENKKPSKDESCYRSNLSTSIYDPAIIKLQIRDCLLSNFSKLPFSKKEIEIASINARKEIKLSVKAYFPKKYTISSTITVYEKEKNYVNDVSRTLKSKDHITDYLFFNGSYYVLGAVFAAIKSL